MKPHLNLIARSNGVGLDRDVDLIHEVASAAGYKVTFSHCRDRSFLARWLPSRPKFDANIFLERIFPRWLNAAPINILIPNQERFPERHLGRLSKIDHVFCKSHHALEIFNQHHRSCHFSGFTSRNLNKPEIERRSNGILHLAGRSTLKGTTSILELWKKHPEWPPLTLLQHPDNAPSEVPENVSLISEYLSEEDLVRLVNEHPIHLCPSLSEGWGHYLVEAMSCGALVITTDGPPMNELVTNERGFLVSVAETEPRHLGTNFLVSPESLAARIEEALNLPETQRQVLSGNAKNWAAQNSVNFQERFIGLLEQLIPQPAS